MRISTSAVAIVAASVLVVVFYFGYRSSEESRLLHELQSLDSSTKPNNVDIFDFEIDLDKPQTKNVGKIRSPVDVEKVDNPVARSPSNKLADPSELVETKRSPVRERPAPALEHETEKKIDRSPLPVSKKQENSDPERKKSDSEATLPPLKEDPKMNSDAVRTTHSKGKVTFNDLGIRTNVPPTFAPDKLQGLENLEEYGLTLPPLKFDFDDSVEAKARRMELKLEEFAKAGMSEGAAKMRAQLFERQLADKKSRALNAQKRALIRIRQDILLAKDEKERKDRMSLMEEKNRQIKAQMEEDKLYKEQQAEEKQKRKEEMERKALEAADLAKKDKEERMKIQLEEAEKAKQEAEERKKQLKEEAERNAVAREKRMQEQRDEKRQMVEMMQGMVKQQMEESKRQAREERLLEAEEAEKKRQARAESLGSLAKPDLQ